MAADDHLSEMQFPHSTGPGHHQITAVHNGDTVGWLQWHDDSPSEHFRPGEITALGVNDSYQRQGVATRMHQEANRIAPVVHSARRTQAGESFAAHVGGEVPPLRDGRHLGDMPGPPLTTYRRQ